MPIIRVRGRSMIPALRPGDILWVRSWNAEAPPRRQILLLRLKRPPGGFFVKRLIGLPGEKVKLHHNAVTINGQPLSETYVSPVAVIEPHADQEFQLSQESYLVLGDTRDDSLDSRRFGAVNADEIVGRAVFRLWPPARWGRV